ncbi:hypothetical protein [Novipirellula artificiosorum]|uniref:Uncharacterized protein n=1 Tax=Novipirellula artificiosorum TaxID=2528016 RepID=A0A5C6DUR0_9BACT|nr:hypothetical protein [Novipirellula artificiosorum]TWU38509.1 hypothetical protein Poly41_29850 [Novipirellula artificiosorum]
MMNNLRFRAGMLVLFVVLSCGCSVESEQLERLTGIASKSSMSSAPAINPAEPVVVQASFKPKYPEREDPFRFPGDEPLVTAKPELSVTKATHVAILGFANLGQAKVIVRMNETTSALAVGEKNDGIEVVEINPPSATLKSGNLVWTATMFGPTKD